MRKRIIATILIFVLVFSFASVALAYSTYDARINIRSYTDSVYRFKPYMNYSNPTLYFTTYAQVYQTKYSTTPLVGDQYAQLFRIKATGQSTLSMSRKYVWNGDSTNYHALDENTYYRIRFSNYDEDYYIQGNVEIRYGQYTTN